ncbi:caspase family protein, partial [Leisingera sp. ANG-M1]|uniref:caspase family protein n=1 Tax=Leisingera sp. ANG-M1 TaxID=1577895 RepID=UPI0023AA1C77
MKAPTGTFLAYATAPGDVALDGEGENSPFTEALAREIMVPGRPVEQVFKHVRRAVLAQSGGSQTPWDTSSLVSDFVFAEAAPEPVLSAAEMQEAQIWHSVKASRDAMQIMLFLRGYGDGKYAGEARALLAELMAEELQGGAAGGQAVAEAPVAAPAPAAAQDAEAAMFEAARADGSKAAYEAYLMAYPEGRFAAIAAAEAAALAAGASQDPEAGGEVAAAAEQPAPAPPLSEPGP